jgi:hypothetical protein
MNRTVLLAGMAIFLGAAAPATQNIEAAHQALISILAKKKILVSGRHLLRADYVCSLTLDGQHYPVTEIIEQVPGATEPKNVARAVVLSPAFDPVWQVELFNARPLFCHANSLFFSEEVRADDATTGNEATFSFGGQGVTMSDADPQQFPTPDP